MRTTSGIEVTALVKGTERYVISYDRETQCEALRTLGRWASNPELSFSWCDAAIMANQIRNQFQGAT